MSYDGRAIANLILDWCEQNHVEISNLSLQKIIFFCHAWNLVKLGKPLIKHNFEAWKFGPVLQYLYREFKDFDSRPITKRAMKLDRQNGNMVEAREELAEDESQLLYQVVAFYSRLTPGQLVEISHVKGGPWDNVWNHDGQTNPGMAIRNEEIVSYYSQVKTAN